MKNWFKKSFVLLLSVAMVFTMMAMPVYAETGEEQDASLSDQYEVKSYPKEIIDNYLNEKSETGTQRQYALVNREELSASNGETLPEIEVSVNNGILSWEPVEGAEGYNFDIDYDEDACYSFFLNEYDIGSFNINEKIDFLIMVGDLDKAEDGNYNVSFTAQGIEEPIARTRWTYHYDTDQEYVPPVEISLEVTDGNLSWTTPEEADSYYLYINDVYVGWLETEENGSFNIESCIDTSIRNGSFEKPDDGVYLLKIQAYSGDNYNYGVGTLTYNYESDAAYGEEIEVNAWIEDGILYWDQVDGADVYEMLVEGAEEYYTLGLYEDDNGRNDPNGFIDFLIKSGEIEKPEDGNYNIVFVAKHNYGAAIGQTSFTYHYESEAEYIEKADITLTVSNGLVSWTEVQDADYYVLYVDGWGNEIPKSENGSYNVDAYIDRQIRFGGIEKAPDGIYFMEINAYDANSDVIGYGSIDYYYESDAEYVGQAEMTLTVENGLVSWTEVEDAHHYELQIGESYSCYLESDENGTFNVNDAIDEALKRGYIDKPEDNVYELIITAHEYYGSQRGEGSLSYTYETEAAYIEPGNITARIEDGILSWDAVEGAERYIVELGSIAAGTGSLSINLKNLADTFYTENMIDQKDSYPVSIRAFDSDDYEIGTWSGTFEYTPEKTEPKQIREVEITNINTDIREGERPVFTTEVGTEGLSIVDQYWYSDDGRRFGDHSPSLPENGDVLNYCFVLEAEWGSAFADPDSIVVKYNGKVIKPFIIKLSNRHLELHNVVPPVIIGDNDDLRIERIAGKTRYNTAFMAADKLKKELKVDKFDNIVIASGTNFPDALAGAYLAKVKNAPVLLARRQEAAAVADYVRNNMKEGGTVYILGGTGAVPSDMEEALKAQGITKAKRLKGKNRYQTNIAILEEAGVKGEDILVCAGEGYADSLSASATGRPVLLVGGKLLPEQEDYLKSIKTKISGNVYAIGGKGAVSESVFKEVCAYAKGEKERLSGTTRYTTSKAVADKFFPGIHNTVVLAYAQDYPDGLAGGPVAYAMNSPLLLVVSSNTAAAKEYATAHASKKCIILGGNSLISDAAALNIVK